MPTVARTCCLLAAFLLFSACGRTVSPMQEELSSRNLPMYDGRFSPIQTPMHLQYRPGAMKLVGQYGIHTNVRDKDEFFSSELYGRLRVLPAGDSLLWEFRLENAVLGDEKIGSGSSPLMEFRARRDAQGNTREAEVTAVGMKLSSQEEKRLFDEIRVLLRSQFRSFTARLPASPVQEGSLLLETDMNAALQAYERLWGSPRCSPQKDKFGYTARGFGSFRGRKVVVAAIEEDFVCLARNERRYSFGLHGYALLDTETGQILEDKTVTTVKSYYSFDSIEVRTLQKVSAEVIE